MDAAAAASRASSAARRLISRALSASPYSASTSGVAPKVFVSTMSAPAARYSACIRRMRSGRVRTRFSLQPSSSGPAEVLGGQVLALHPRARGPVEDQDPLGEELVERLGPLVLAGAGRGGSGHGTRHYGGSNPATR